MDIDILNAWIEASKELGLNIQSPFILQTNNSKTEYVLLIKDFGSKLGTVVLTNRMQPVTKEIKENNYYYSILGQGYRKYNRESFIDTLKCYYGDINAKPIGYSGHLYKPEK